LAYVYQGWREVAGLLSLSGRAATLEAAAYPAKFTLGE
jgi:hypothetical protein